MMGIDLEQFLRDPYGSGIQRVLQALARHWPADVPVHFLVPDPDDDNRLIQMGTEEADRLISLAFSVTDSDESKRESILSAVRDSTSPRIAQTALSDQYSHWFLPEVSYLPRVLERFSNAKQTMRTLMIGYDILPMSEPANYRFDPGTAAWVSEYFRMLATADAVACISEHSLRAIVDRLRREASLVTVVAHPGGDHIPVMEPNPPQRLRFCRVGTLEARKRPVEILNAFTSAIDSGLEADLVYVGRRAPSSAVINDSIDAAISAGYPIAWIEDATDDQVIDIMATSSVFLSVGIEGYGIPVLESIRVGTPVLYDGIQPAADLMEGKGALRIEGDNPTALRESLIKAPSNLDRLRQEVAPNAVPTWREFVGEIVRTCT